jgi:hypothetical protein
MTKSNYQNLAEIKKDRIIRFKEAMGDVALCPDMGGRVFAELDDISPHRIDLDAVKSPDKPFNNYGGGNYWPAPEGGNFGFNYRGNEWYVQPAINKELFQIVKQQPNSATIQKKIKLTNRLGTVVETTMTRQFSLLANLPMILNKQAIKCALSYETIDTFEVHNSVSVDQALLASWTLEQFQATPDTVSFVLVNKPQSAINFDFYDHPGKRIQYHENGFTYKTDGHGKGQIGIRKDSQATMIGFYDLSRNLLCLRQKINPDDGVFFNIADNDQPQGPYSAADTYSIFNSDPDMMAFELETISGANVKNGLLTGSELTSRTTFAIFESSKSLDEYVANLLGKRV